jgi:hypothetical protein
VSTAAIVVGVDDYAENPLTSAVNDAMAFGSALSSLDLVPAADVRMFTAPVRLGSELATKKNIKDCLWEYYSGARRADRLYFYFAGHGMSVYGDVTRSVTRSVIVPCDVRNLDRDGDNLISVDELVDRFRLVGPAEQLYFIDACRDLPYDRHPDPGTLGWAAVDPIAARAQAVLYAVSPLGKAISERDGMGVFTTHLIDALHGRGVALDYSEPRDAYVVTAQSIRAYVRGKVEGLVSTKPLWERQYMLPELHAPDPPMTMLREVGQVDPVDLTVHVEPDDAADKTAVRLWKSRFWLQDLSWPPNGNHSAVRIDPQWYRLEATSEVGTADPAKLTVDAREVSEVTIHIQSAETPTSRATSDTGIVAPGLVSVVAAPTEAFRGVGAGLPGNVSAHAEALVTIEM